MMEIVKPQRKQKLYLIRVRHPDGTWSVDEETTYTKREAEKLCQFNRIMGGISSQIWPYKEWMKSHSTNNPTAKSVTSSPEQEEGVTKC